MSFFIMENKNKLPDQNNHDLVVSSSTPPSTPPLTPPLTVTNGTTTLDHLHRVRKISRCKSLASGCVLVVACEKQHTAFTRIFVLLFEYAMVPAGTPVLDVYYWYSFADEQYMDSDSHTYGYISE